MLFYDFPRYQLSYTRIVIANSKANVSYVSSSLVTSHLAGFLANQFAIKYTIQQNTYMQKLTKLCITN